MIFANLYNGAGYDLVLLGQKNPGPIDVDDLEQRLARPEYAAVSRSLGEIGMRSALDLFATYAGNARDMAPWLHDAQINRDRNLRLQYLAGRGLNLYRADAIFADMVPYAKDPDHVFTGSEKLVQTLLQKIRRSLGKCLMPSSPPEANQAGAQRDRPIHQRRKQQDRKSTRLNSSHIQKSRMPSSA